jgi:hypothetical protein
MAGSPIHHMPLSNKAITTLISSKAQSLKS